MANKQKQQTATAQYRQGKWKSHAASSDNMKNIEMKENTAKVNRTDAKAVKHKRSAQESLTEREWNGYNEWE